MDKAINFISRHPSGCAELDTCLLSFIEKYDDEFLSTLLNEEKENPEKAYCTLLLTFLLDTSSDEENEEEDDDDGYLNHNLLFN